MDFALLAKVLGISNQVLVAGFKKYGCPEAFLKAPLAELKPFVPGQTFQTLRSWQSRAHIPDSYKLAEELVRTSAAKTIYIGEPDFPKLLSEIADPPAVLFVRGDISNLCNPQIAVVGSRNATAAGMHLAQQFSSELALAGFTITSGLAQGIDGAAHRGALQASGPTVAVMGTGIDRIYPSRHAGLAENILEQGGALISEFLPGSPPRAYHFPMRNRIVSGVSMGLLVVEAGEKSGSLISARLAAEQGREVCVVPGNIRSPVSAGCNRLIRDGATLVTNSAQVVEQLGPIFLSCLSGPQRESEVVSAHQEDTNWLLSLIGFDAMTADEICVLSGRSPAQVTVELAELEMEGKVVATGYGYQRTL